MHYYVQDNMSKDRMTEFLEWYEIHTNNPFAFQKEMCEYWISDVTYLISAHSIFIQLLKKYTGVRETVEDPPNLTLETILSKVADPFF